jgi:acyl dehydratase
MRLVAGSRSRACQRPESRRRTLPEVRRRLVVIGQLRRSLPAAVEPIGDLVGVEAEQVAPLDVRDAAFGHQAANVPLVHGQVLGHAGDVQEPGKPTRLRTVRRQPAPQRLGVAARHLRPVTQAATTLRLDALGVWTQERTFSVTAERIAAYALATNDPYPAHVGGELAPPLFAVVPVQETVGLGLTGPMATVVPHDVMMTGLHSEHDLRIHRPILPGTVLKVRGAPVGVHAMPRGTAVVVRFVTSDERGRVVNEQYFKALFRAVREPIDVGEDMPDHRLPGEATVAPPVATFALRADSDQTFRYAAASGDDMIVHLDDAVARSVGLPGIIVHGLCTMAFISQGLSETVAGGDPTRLRRLAVRFTHPLLPGQSFATRVWRLADSYGFQSATEDGQTILKDGLARIGPPSDRTVPRHGVPA